MNAEDLASASASASAGLVQTGSQHAATLSLLIVNVNTDLVNAFTM
jgi:hypothetical protein